MTADYHPDCEKCKVPVQIFYTLPKNVCAGLFLAGNQSRASNIDFLLDIAQMSDLDFGLIQQNISIKKGFIPISRAPSFFQKLQVVIKFLYF